MVFEKGNRANALHGILLMALFSFAAFYLSELQIMRELSLSPLIIGIILGMLYANSLRQCETETIEHDTCAQYLLGAELDARYPSLGQAVAQAVGVEHAQDDSDNEWTERKFAHYL